MLTNSEAIKLVSENIQKMSPVEDPYVVNESKTVEKSFGWVFFYNSKKFLETGAIRDRLAGNGPVIVNRVTGEILFCGSNKPVEELIHDYERKLIG